MDHAYVVIANVGKVSVNCNLPVSNLIRRGRFDYVNSAINDDNFAISGTGIRRIGMILMRFRDKHLTTEQVVELVRLHGCRPSRIEELLALACRRPRLKTYISVVSLGTLWRDDDRIFVPSFSSYSERVLRLTAAVPDEARWDETHQFACMPIP